MIKGRDLDNRAVIGSSESLLQAGKDAAAGERLAQLEQRLVQARTLKPTGKDLHCEDCFQRGRDAVLRLLGDPA